MKTLDESAKELKEAVDRLHKARMNFMESYAEVSGQHWCNRVMNDEDYEASKMDGFQQYYPGDLTQQ
jgi:hypothetical protein